MLTITLASKSVLDQFKNWLYFFRDYKGFRLLAYCTDEESILFCEKNNIEYKNIIEAHRENGNNFWITKSYIFNETSKTDNFIYSDLDAIWIKNPIKYLKKFNNLEILFSQGTYFPEITRDRLGFVFCAGFFIVNNNEKLKLFFNEVYKLSKNSDINDDQYHLNTLLMYDLKFKSNINKKEVDFKGEKFFVFDSLLEIYSEKYKINIGLLPHKFFTRNDKLDRSEAIVLHPLSKSDYRDVIYFFHQEGLLHEKYSSINKILRIFINKTLNSLYFLKNNILKYSR